MIGINNKSSKIMNWAVPKIRFLVLSYSLFTLMAYNFSDEMLQGFANNIYMR